MLSLYCCPFRCTADFFVALYNVLSVSIELRQASFIQAILMYPDETSHQ